MQTQLANKPAGEYGAESRETKAKPAALPISRQQDPVATRPRTEQQRQPRITSHSPRVAARWGCSGAIPRARRAWSCRTRRSQRGKHSSAGQRAAADARTPGHRDGRRDPHTSPRVRDRATGRSAKSGAPASSLRTGRGASRSTTLPGTRTGPDSPWAPPTRPAGTPSRSRIAVARTSTAER